MLMIDTMKNQTKKISLLFLFICCVVTVFIYRTRFLPVYENVENSAHLLGNNNNTCLKTYFVRGIDQIQKNINTVFFNPGCSSLYRKFTTLYEVDVFHASQTFGQDFSKKMKGWLGDNSAMLKLAEFQTIFVVHDILRQKTTVFNPLRSRRPALNSQDSLISFLKNISESSKDNCDFCNPFIMTARDTFGRIQGQYAVSASNAFKLGKWHGLFIPFKHSIFDIDSHIFLDIFNVSLKWFKKVHSLDGNAKYPVLFWDTFPHAGASQIHMHVHGVMGERHYPGQFEDILNIVRTFRQVQNAHYWNTVVEIHELFGLTMRFGKTIAISPLVPQREHELWLLNNEPSNDFFMLLYIVIKMYQERFQKYCFSMAGALPVLGNKHADQEQSLPSVIFIGTRGDCSSLVSDVSSLELYLFNNVNTDPYDTIEALQKHERNFASKYNINKEMENLWSDVSFNPA